MCLGGLDLIPVFASISAILWLGEFLKAFFLIGIILVVILATYTGKVYQFFGKLFEQYKTHPGDVSNQG